MPCRAIAESAFLPVWITYLLCGVGDPHDTMMHAFDRVLLALSSI